MRKNPGPAADNDPWLTATTPPDYKDWHLTPGSRRHLLSPADRVVLVDDWIDTGGQASGARALVDKAEAGWLGVAVVVDALTRNEVRPGWVCVPGSASGVATSAHAAGRRDAEVEVGPYPRVATRR